MARLGPPWLAHLQNPNQRDEGDSKQPRGLGGREPGSGHRRTSGVRELGRICVCGVAHRRFSARSIAAIPRPVQGTWRFQAGWRWNSTNLHYTVSSGYG